MFDEAPNSPSKSQRQFLTFMIDEHLYALPAEDVAEVIRIPSMARLPRAPYSLLGLANLRGSVLPVTSLRRLLGKVQDEPSSGRAIVLERVSPVALTVDSIYALLTVKIEQLETRQAELSAEPDELLTGAFVTDDERPIKVLDIDPLLAKALSSRADASRPARKRQINAPASKDIKNLGYQKLVIFSIAEQEYAFELGAVLEVIVAPKSLVSDPSNDGAVLGLSAYRNTLLPSLSLRGLLGFAPLEESDGREKIVIVKIDNLLVGLLVDHMSSIVSAAEDLLEAPSAILSARSDAESKIKAIYRGEGGRRLVSVLSPERLFRDDVMQRLNARRQDIAEKDTYMESVQHNLKFLVFRLGFEEFALNVNAVDEVANIPEQITRLPKTPDFLEGIINLRGEVLPIIDQRKRFDMPAVSEGMRRRLIVVDGEHHRAGLIVDSVSEVLTCSQDMIEPAPDLAGESTRLVFGVVNLEQTGRMILLLEPSELLSHFERGILDSFKITVDQDAS